VPTAELIIPGDNLDCAAIGGEELQRKLKMHQTRMLSLVDGGGRSNRGKGKGGGATEEGQKQIDGIMLVDAKAGKGNEWGQGESR